MHNTELYIHIPFCLRKCEYCDFLSAPAEAEKREEYVQALIREIETCGDAAWQETTGCVLPVDTEISSIYIGGGTPSILEGEQMFRIMAAVRKKFKISEYAEISIEVNPGAVDMKKLSRYRIGGINRVSIGLQSANDRMLRILGRIHTLEDFKNTYNMVREAGFRNVSVDLIHSLPGQTVEDWEQSLRFVAELGPEHMSCYSLIIEEGTPFFEKFGDIAGEARVNGVAGEFEAAEAAGAAKADETSESDIALRLPTEDEDREMDRATERILEEYGYVQYEISNYAKDGCECIHNLGYWSNVPYIGVGLGSSSYVEGVRFSNTRDLDEYIAAEGCVPKCEVTKLEEQDLVDEFFFLGLRRREGISLNDFRERFGHDWEQFVPAMDEMCEQGFMERESVGTDVIYRLTKDGMDVSNTVFCKILIED